MRHCFTGRFVSLIAVFLACKVCLAEEASPESLPSAEQVEFVRAKVAPLLESRCFECHKHKSEFGGSLFLGSRQGMLRGGDSGAAIVPGKPHESLLIEAVRYESFEMPPRTRMPDQEVAILERWIAEGAVWPADLNVEPKGLVAAFPLEERRRSHWAWQPITNPEVPRVKSNNHVDDPIDAFVVARLDAAGLSPNRVADRYTLIRRLYFDLIGLPPSTAEIQAFVNDGANDRDAVAVVVDQLLASPHFGERWGRHWLDLVRYAESLGHEFDYPLHHAWRYRDYVIRAFNADIPYDQFAKEHIAGDLLPNPRRHPELDFNESIIGTGFWFLHEDKHAPVDVRGEEASKIDNQIDVFSKTFLGMTVACARCHDHKFDAISTHDYYALAGFLQSSRRQSGWLDPGRKIQRRVTQLVALRDQTANAIQDTVAAHVADEKFLKPIATAIADIRERTGPEAVDDAWSTLLQRDVKAATDGVISFPAFLAKQAADRPIAEIVAAWAKKYQSPSAESQTTPWADFTEAIPGGWFTFGQAFSQIARQQLSNVPLAWFGEDLRINNVAPVHSATLATELQGMLSSPTFELQHPEILVRVTGEKSRVRVVIDGYLMYEFNGLLFGGMKQDINTEGEPRWLRLAGDLHRYQGHRMHLEFLDEGNGWFNVHEVRFANSRGAAPPAPSPSRFNANLAEALQHDGAVGDADAALKIWSQHVAADPTVAGELLLQELIPASDALNAATNAWKTSASSVPAPTPILAICDGTPEDEHIFIRGNHKNLGDVAPRSILTALQLPVSTSNPPETLHAGSGRLQLAEDVLSEQNPLTSRVIVNRVWHHLFGAGLVESTDNFGVLGKPPTHPELLDHLATRFRNDGWSIKSLIRNIVLSRSYRISSRPTAAGNRLDPTNKLLHSARVKRLQGEAVRDALLTVSGRLNRTMFGTPIPLHLTAFMQGRGRPRVNGPVDGDGRRSVYLAVLRNFLSPFMLAFDVPAPVSTTGNRTSSNVPAQALMLLNNEFVNQQVTLWAKRLLADEGRQTPSQRIAEAWFELLGRPASEQDLVPLLQFANVADKADVGALSESQLADICHVLINSKEFTFVR